MLRKSFILTLLICMSFALPSFADTFLWSYNVPGIDASGTFLTAPLSAGTYTILEITGQRNGETIIGLGDLGSANNLLYATFPHFDFFGLAYFAGGTEFNLYGTVETGPFGQNPLLIETYLVFDPPFHQVDTEVRAFSLTRVEAVPEPSSVVLVCSGLMALVGRRRLLRLRNR
jgi:hypothetical protein